MGGLIAFPSGGQGGLEAPVSEHFGRCATFTLVEASGGEARRVDVVPAGVHAEGGCVAIVRMLAERGVRTVVAVGMGGRPLGHLLQAGIDVYQGDAARSISVILEDLESGRLPRFGTACAHRPGNRDGDAKCGCA